MATDKKIIFVCLGNICRSPAAEGVMRSMVERAGASGRIFLDSAGTYGGHAGESPDKRMRRAASARGYELTGRSRPFTRADFDKFDMVIAMDDYNYEDLNRLAPDTKAAAKIYRMTDFSYNKKYDHVPDPYYEGAEGFETVLDILEDACKGLLDEILKT